MPNIIVVNGALDVLHSDHRCIPPDDGQPGHRVDVKRAVWGQRLRQIGRSAPPQEVADGFGDRQSFRHGVGTSHCIQVVRESNGETIHTTTIAQWCSGVNLLRSRIRVDNSILLVCGRVVSPKEVVLPESVVNNSLQHSHLRRGVAPFIGTPKIDDADERR